MARGLRFFGADYNTLQFEAAITVSSSDNLKEFAFDGFTGTRWTTSGENTDGNAVSLEVNYGFNRTIDSFYVYKTNIENIVLAYWNGSSWVNITGSNATIVKSSDNMYVFAKLNASITIQKVRITGSDTLTPNEEKYVGLFIAFLEIGRFEYFPGFSPVVEPFQDVFKTTDGRSFIIERGESFGCTLDLKSHVNQNDIDLATQLLERKEPFFIWPNGGNDEIFRFSFKPFRFKDIFKVSIIGANSPEFTRNYYRAGYNNTLKMVEVV